MTPRIYFIHGLGSLPTTASGVRLDAATGIPSTKLSYNAAGTWEENILSLQQQTEDADSNSIFVGESMGGFFAAQLAAQYKARCYLLNPATVPAHQLLQFVGPFTIDGGTVVNITVEAVQSYNAALDPRRANTINKFGLMLSYEDELITPNDAAAYYANWSAFIDWVHDGHGIAQDSSYDIIGARINAWGMDTAFPRSLVYQQQQSG